MAWSNPPSIRSAPWLKTFCHVIYHNCIRTQFRLRGDGASEKYVRLERGKRFSFIKMPSKEENPYFLTPSELSWVMSRKLLGSNYDSRENKVSSFLVPNSVAPKLRESTKNKRKRRRKSFSVIISLNIKFGKVGASNTGEWSGCEYNKLHKNLQTINLIKFSNWAIYHSDVNYACMRSRRRERTKR